MKELMFIIGILILPLIYLPVYLQKRKLWRMADEDLKKIDRADWKKQIRANAWIRLINCLLWGVFVLSNFFFQYVTVGLSRLGGVILALLRTAASGREATVAAPEL